jgi:uncharacterized protein
MIVYQNSVEGFSRDIINYAIVDRIKEAYLKKTGQVKFNDKEEQSWANSLIHMKLIIQDSGIPGDCGVLVEFGLPSTSKRIDFIIAGRDDQNRKNFVIVELKQWTEAESTTKEDVVITPYYGRAMTTHPSYQASAYKSYLSDFNENVYTQKLNPYSCAFLHNYRERSPEPLKATIYARSIADSPIYFRDDHSRLREFLFKHVGRGNGTEILFEIENGNIRPSKQLMNHVAGLFRGNPEFVLMEEQKVAYEVALEAGLQADAARKRVILIQGGPGTGKSVISMSLLGGFLSRRKNAFFVAPNASFRDTMLEKLAHGQDKQRAKLLLTGSAKYVDAPANSYDILIVDEAHRLKNGNAFMYKGDNQVRDIIHAAKVSVFFVDDAQMIRPQDIGSSNEIRRLAASFGAEVVELKLNAQFRCDGAEGFVNWINDVLQIERTGNFDGWDRKSFEFIIAESPNELHRWISHKSTEGHNARLLAGYAWPWTSAKDGNANGQVTDVAIPEHGFAMPWNSRHVGTTWATAPDGLHQVGCVHTSQGLEFDYVGIIVGKDLEFRLVDREGESISTRRGDLFSSPESGQFSSSTVDGNTADSFPEIAADCGQTYSAVEEYKLASGQYITRWENYYDTAGKSGLKNNPERLNQMIRNIYRILFTRGMKGCGVYFCDRNLERYFRYRLSKTTTS